MSERRVVVVGSRGLVGSAVLREAFARPDASRFRAGSIRSDDMASDVFRELDTTSTVIWCAGSSDHAAPALGPNGQYDKNVEQLASLVDVFSGRLVLLTSQAIYEGHVGPVPADVATFPVNPYARSKLLGEALIRAAVESGRVRSATCVRLMYAFGPGERAHRLLPRAAEAAVRGVPLAVRGGGRSYLNPLPVTFVAKALLAVADRDQRSPFAAYNLNHPTPATVLDILRIAQKELDLTVEVSEGGELQPVHFYGEVGPMTQVLSEAGLSIPDPEASIRPYVRDLKEQRSR